MNLRRLNYILIPGTSESWDRWGDGRFGRLIRPWFSATRTLTREGQIMVVAVMVAGAAGVDLRYSNLFLVFSGLTGLLMAGAVMRPFARLRQTRLVVDCPPRITAGEPMSFTARIINEGDKPIFALRPRGPFLPWDGVWISARPGVPFVGAGEEGQATLQASFHQRGRRLVGRFWVASSRPLGLFMGNRIYSQKVRITVVPRVCEVRGLPAPAVVSEPPESRDPVRGGGDNQELLGVRPYRAGDRIRDLHARSWARTGQPMVREYRQASRRRAVVCLVGRAGASEDSFDAATSVAASLVEWGLKAGAVVDLVVVGAQIEVHRIGERSATFDWGLDALAVAQPTATPEVPKALARFLGRTGALYLVCPKLTPEDQILAQKLAAGARCRTGLFAVYAGRKVPKPVSGVTFVHDKSIADSTPIEAQR